MRRSSSGLNVPLNERQEGGPSSGTAEPARPCWVRLGPATEIPGTVHAWQRDTSTGKWRALVAVWLPAEAVSRRQE